jgi:hypothetical protein
VGAFFLDFFCGGIVSCFLAETTVGANVGGLKIGWDPRTQDLWINSRMQERERRQSTPESLCSPQKLWTPLHVPSGSPFIWRRRDFYISRLPSNLENIPSVNMYMNVFYTPWFAGLISYIYKPATSSHFKTGLFEMTSLTWPSTDFQNLIREDHHLSRLMNWDSLNFPKFAGSWLPEFARFQSSWNKKKTRDPHANSAVRFAHCHWISEVQKWENTFKNASLRIFSRIFRHDVHSRNKNAMSVKQIFHHEAHSRIYSRTQTFRGWKVFVQLPKSIKGG